LSCTIVPKLKETTAAVESSHHMRLFVIKRGSSGLTRRFVFA
jgi:hypothetical protein